MSNPSDYNLSEGALQTIMSGGDVKEPIMQVLGSKKITSGNSEKERYRILLSDGRNSISFAMLTTQINDKVGSNGLENNTVIKIVRYVTSVINNTGKGDTRVLLILDMEIIARGDSVGQRLGSPTPLTDNAASSKPPSTNGTPSNGHTSSSNNVQSTSNKTASVSNGDISSTTLHGQLTHPISSLSPYHNKWIIKARITTKSAIRTWSNSRGEGKLFSIDLVDESGEIRCTAFRDMVDKYYEMLQVDKVYYISKCQLKPANKQFSSLKNDYEMTMTSETVIQECTEEDNSIPQTKYDFVPIDKIAHMEPNTIVDVIGVTKSVGDLQTFQAKSTGRELKKKDVILVDQSKTSIALTLWGSDAENFDGSNNPVVVIKGARLSEFGGGKNLSTVSSSTLKINPEIVECYRIRGWYETEGSNMEVVNISARSGGGTFQTPWMSFKEVLDQGLGNAEKGDYYQTMGTVLLIKSENCIYKACPTEECNKKVIDMENSMYRCEKCNREYPNFKYRLLASMNIGDYSGNQWVSMFSSEAEKILGMTSQEVGEAMENSPEAMNLIADKANFKQFIFKCRVKMETYNDEARLKTVVVKVDPINYEEYNAHLIERIGRLLA